MKNRIYLLHIVRLLNLWYRGLSEGWPYNFWAVQEELETLLNDSGQLRTLAFLYASKGMSSKALAIWRILARNYSSEYQRESTEINDPQDATRLVVSGKDAAAIEACRILEELSDQNLVLQHLGWVWLLSKY